MVNLVSNPLRDHSNHYLELNQQLARENGELRQQLGQAAMTISHQKEDLHRKEEEILRLKQQVRDLAPIVKKFREIKDIVLHDQLVDCYIELTDASIRAIEPAPRGQRQVLSLPSATGEPERNDNRVVGTDISDVDESEQFQKRSDSYSHSPNQSGQTKASSRTTDDEETVADENDELNDSVSTYDAAEAIDRLSEQPLHRISEREEEEEEEETMNEQQNRECRGTLAEKEEQNKTTVENLSQSSTLRSVELQPPEDSLLPPDVTSVPPIDQPPERTIHTPSVWNCLDSITNPTEEPEKSQEAPKLQDPNSNTTNTTPASSSPIQPIKRKSSISNVCGPDNQISDMYQSTPVLAQKNPQTKNIQLSIIEQSHIPTTFERPKTPTDQENHVTHCADETLTPLSNHREQQQPHMAPLQPNPKIQKGKKVESKVTAKRNLPNTEQAPTRYNLRKRSKV